MRRDHEMKRIAQLSLATLFTVAMSVVAFQALDAQFSGKVVSIADGDTITVLVNTEQHRIRLEGIDAPESAQAFGTKAKQALGDKIFGKQVTVKWKSRDKYQRILGHVYLGDRHINIELLQEGFAWHFTKYNSDPELSRAEKAAKEAKRGLWADPKPIAPWDYRKGVTDAPMALLGTQEVTVYITQSGTKYHRSGCRHLSKSSTAISLKDAQARFSPCGTCNPPR